MSVSSNPLSPTSTVLTSKGDLILHTGTAQVRVPVGTDGQYLVANSSNSTGVNWSTTQTALDAGYSTISTQTLTANTSAVFFTNIPQTYKNLVVSVIGQNTDTTNGYEIRITFVSTTTDPSATYYYKHWYSEGGGASVVHAATQTRIEGRMYMPANTIEEWGFASILIPDYTSNVDHILQGYAMSRRGFSEFCGLSSANQTFTDVRFTLSAGSFKSGSEFILYGIK